MKHQVMQISALEKVRANEELNFNGINKIKAMQGERVSYQIVLKGERNSRFRAVVSVKSELASAVALYSVKEVVMDMPVTVDFPDEDYITKEPGLMPDVLVPLSEQKFTVTVTDSNSVLWVRIDVPEDIAPGKYVVSVQFKMTEAFSDIPENTLCKDMEIEIIPAVIPQQKLIYTRWFYADCIAEEHNVPIYSEKHWELIEKYIAAAHDVGINMILVPIHTPPLDTEIGAERPCVQLVDIERIGDEYKFGFEKFHRFISICKKCGIKYYEMAHMFSQWGAKYTPNIMVRENGQERYMFGWHMPADSPVYLDFVSRYIKAVCAELTKEGIADNTYFHISDEPDERSMENYERAYKIIKPLVGKSKLFDAISDFDFYEKGIVENPVPCISSINDFLGKDIEHLWTYYCCEPQNVYPNSFLAMPSARVRVLGYMLYKYDIKGFLHWGLNFYNSFKSWYKINPYLTTSADSVFPSGDGYILYPGKDTVYGSIRGEVTYQAIIDMNICFALEEIIGRDAVIKMIDKAAGGELRFDQYPSGNSFLEELRLDMINKIEAHNEEK